MYYENIDVSTLLYDETLKKFQLNYLGGNLT